MTDEEKSCEYLVRDDRRATFHECPIIPLDRVSHLCHGPVSERGDSLRRSSVGEKTKRDVGDHRKASSIHRSCGSTRIFVIHGCEWIVVILIVDNTSDRVH